LPRSKFAFGVPAPLLVVLLLSPPKAVVSGVVPRDEVVRERGGVNLRPICIVGEFEEVVRRVGGGGGGGGLVVDVRRALAAAGSCE